MIRQRRKQTHSPAPLSSSVGVALVVVLAILLGAGFGHRLLEKRIALALAQPLAIAQPLATLPMQIGEWQGRGVPLDANVRRIAAEDDYINRRYSRARPPGRSVGLYVGYVGRPRSRLGHRPDLCYPAPGRQRLAEEKLMVKTQTGREVPGILYEFRSSQVGGPRELVLATYLINGEYRDDPAAVGGYNSRDANLFGRQSPYLGRVQVSLTASGDRSADLAVLTDFASTVAEPIASLMPYVEEPGGSDRPISGPPQIE